MHEVDDQARFQAFQELIDKFDREENKTLSQKVAAIRLAALYGDRQTNIGHMIIASAGALLLDVTYRVYTMLPYQSWRERELPIPMHPQITPGNSPDDTQ